MHMKRTIAIGVLFVLSAVFAISAVVPVADPGPRGEPHQRRRVLLGGISAQRYSQGRPTAPLASKKPKRFRPVWGLSTIPVRRALAANATRNRRWAAARRR